MNAIASRALVVVAHPCANSFCGGLAELVVTTLRARRVVDVVALWPFGAAGDFSADQPTAVAAVDPFKRAGTALRTTHIRPLASLTLGRQKLGCGANERLPGRRPIPDISEV